MIYGTIARFFHARSMFQTKFLFFLYPTVNKIVVRPEEAFIVILVIVLWIGAILLFIHRWGKIRMLEPYAPKFEEAIHRPSCGPLTFEAIATKRMSLGVMSIQCGPASWNQSTLNLNRGE